MDKTSNEMNTERNMMDRGLSAYYTLFSGILLAMLALGHGCNVEIQKPYHPMYVQTGQRLELVCTARNCKAGERVRLQWWRQSEESSWDKAKIVPHQGGRWVTRNLHEEPSGDVESTLVLSDISVADHGWYVCRDEEAVNSYTIWVSTLRVDATPNVTLPASGGDDITLGCSVSGPSSNMPAVEYLWMLGDLRVINISNRFTLHPPDVGTQRLQIHKPKKRDGGIYTCLFIFRTNLGPVIFSRSIYVDTSLMAASGSRRSLLHNPLLAAVFLVMAVSQWL